MPMRRTAMAQKDLMLAVVGRFAGPGLAKACANYLLLDQRRSQAPFMAITYLAGQDERIAKAERETITMGHQPRIAFTSRYSSNPNTPNSRPLPDCL